MSGHVFISYSHNGDSTYVNQLADHLATAGIRVWYDSEIIAGDRWQTVIREQVDTCAAMIVVMSPEAEQSKWVQREINQAEETSRPILPLLRSGRAFFRLSDVQHEDVTTGHMPSNNFLTRLRAHQPPPRVLALNLQLTEEDELSIRHADALKAAAAGDHINAAEMHRQLIIDRTRLLSPNHPSTLDSRHNRALNIGVGGDRTEAVKLFREVVADRTRVLGAHHPSTLDSRHSLAYNIGQTGNRAEAVKLLREVVADQTRVLGADHPETLTSRHNLAYGIRQTGDLTETIRLFREVVADRTRVLGADHPYTLDSRHNLAYSIGQTGSYTEAVKLLREVVADRTRVLGADHPHTLVSRNVLAYNMEKTGEHPTKPED